MGLLRLEDVEKDRPVYLVGIGGAGMSAIAAVLIEMGYSVEGSDLKESANVRRLRRLGVPVAIGHRPENLRSPSLVIRSSAVRDENLELVEARKRGIPVFSRAEMLGAIMRTKKSIAVAGTHGKTTTTSLVVQGLRGCGEDPSYLIGGELNETGSNAHHGKGDFLVAEADESDGTILLLEPDFAVLTNVDSDHLDYFRDISKVAVVFSEFLGRIRDDGFAVICGDDSIARQAGEIIRKLGREVIFYGRSGKNEYNFDSFRNFPDGCEFDVFRGGGYLGKVRLRVGGIHNAYNSLAALATCHRLGLPHDEVMRSFADFRGVRRRFELVDEIKGVKIVDDYAHHPTEIEAVLGFASSLGCARVLVVFQPHRYSRTRVLARLFGESFEKADVVVLTDVYGAGEEPEPGVSGELIADSIRERFPAKEIHYFPDRATLANNVAPLIRPGDMVITMGAGDITQCAREISAIIRSSRGSKGET